MYRRILDIIKLIFKLLRRPGINSTESVACKKSILMWYWFLETLILCEGIEDFRIVMVMCCVWGKDIPIGQHISNMQTIWRRSARVEKVDSFFKNLFFVRHGRLDYCTYLVLTQFQESIYPPPHKPSKNTGSGSMHGASNLKHFWHKRIHQKRGKY